MTSTESMPKLHHYPSSREVSEKSAVPIRGRFSSKPADAWRTAALVGLILILMSPVQFGIVVLANRLAPNIFVDLRTDALLTPGNHTVRVGGALIPVKTIEHRERRLATVGSTELVHIAYVDADECRRSIDTAKQTGVISGTAQVALADGSSVFATGSLIAQSRVGDADLYSFHGTATGSSTDASTVSVTVADISIDCDVYAMPSGARRLTEHEVHESMRRHLLEVKNASLDYDHTAPHPHCLVSHCFAGERGCADPAPETLCMMWDAADGSSTRRCKKPLCKIAQQGFHPHERRKLAGRPDACFSREAGMACRKVAGGSGSVADAYAQCFDGRRALADDKGAAAAGEAVLMAELSGGEEVLAVASDGTLFFDRVVYNAHKANAARREEVIELSYAGGSLSVTLNHMLHLDGVDAPARLATVGSTLHTAQSVPGGTGTVRVERVSHRGLQSIINPVTMSGRVLAVDQGGRVPVRALTVDEAFAPFLTADRNLLVNGLLPFFSLAAYLFPHKAEAYASVILGLSEEWSPFGTWIPAVIADVLVLPVLMPAWAARHALGARLPALSAAATSGAAVVLAKAGAVTVAKARLGSAYSA